MRKLMVKAAPGEPANLQTPLSAAVDFSAVGASSDPLSEGISQILSIVQEIRGELTARGQEHAEVARRRDIERTMTANAARIGEIAVEMDSLVEKLKKQPASKVIQDRLHLLEEQYTMLRHQAAAIHGTAAQT